MLQWVVSARGSRHPVALHVLSVCAEVFREVHGRMRLFITLLGAATVGSIYKS